MPEITSVEIEAGRDWLLDAFPEMSEYISDMDGDEIIAGVDTLYIGGWSEFMNDGCDIPLELIS